MTVVQLWFGLDDALEWLWENVVKRLWDLLIEVMTPAFNLLSTTLESVFTVIYDTFIKSAWELFMEFVYMQFYLLEAAVLLILDAIEDAFNVISGISPVLLDGHRMTLLEAVYRQEGVQSLILAMIVLSFVLCFFCSILAVIRSTLSLGEGKSRPVTHVLRETGRAMLIFLIIPLSSAFLISLSGVILTAIDQGLSQGDDKTSMARIIFCISTLDALDTDKLGAGAESYNVGYEGKVAEDMGIRDKYRKEFYVVDPDDTVPAFANPVRVKEKFQFRKMDIFTGIIAALFFTVVMCMVLFVFISRIFDVVVLLVIEPFFVAPMPLDDGDHFRRWLELFIGRLLGGYGTVVAIRVYFMLAELIFNHSISFTDRSGTGAKLQDYLISLIFCAGGAYAVQHIGPLITGLLSGGAASSEQSAAGFGAMAGRYISSLEWKGLQFAGGKVTEGAEHLAGNMAGGFGSVLGETISGIGKGSRASGGGSGNQFNGSRGGSALPSGGSGEDSSGNKFNNARPQQNSLYSGALPALAESRGEGTNGVIPANNNPVRDTLAGNKKEGPGEAGKGAFSMDDILKADNAEDEGGNRFSAGNIQGNVIEGGVPDNGADASFSAVFGEVGGAGKGAFSMDDILKADDAEDEGRNRFSTRNIQGSVIEGGVPDNGANASFSAAFGEADKGNKDGSFEELLLNNEFIDEENDEI